MKKIILGFSIMAIVLTSCKKGVTIADIFLPIPGSNTNVKFINLSPDAPTFNFIANSVKATSATPTGTNAVTGLGYGGFYPAGVAYATLPSGSIKLDVKVPDSSTIMPAATLLTLTQTFDPGKYYTLVVVDSLGSLPSRLSTVISQDDPTVADPTKAYFRISNYIANSDIKVEITKTSTIVGDYAYAKTFTSVAAKTVLAFDTLAAGLGQAYKIMLKNPITDAKLDSIVGFAPTNTKKYTLYARGVMGLTSPNTRRPLILNYVNF